MTRPKLLAAALAALILSGGAFWAAQRAGISVLGAADSLDEGLTYQPLGDYLQSVPGVEAVALYDRGQGGAQNAQWYLLTDPAAHADVRFGFLEGRIVDELLGFHLTVYCSSGGLAKGKYLWPLKAGEIVKPRVYCARSRMDLAALIAVAVPARLVQPDGLSAAAVAQLQDRIARDPRLVAASTPAILPHQAECTARFPFVWEPQDAPDSVIWRYDEAIRSLLAEVPGGDPDFDLWIDNGNASGYVIHPVDGTDVSAEGWQVNTPYVFIDRQGETRKAPGLWLYRPEITLRGQAAECEAFSAFDFSSLWAGDRNLGLLQAAWANGVPQAADTAPFQDWDDITSPEGARASVKAISYSVMYFEALSP